MNNDFYSQLDDITTRLNVLERYSGGGGSGVPVDGWVSAEETWTYASASTFTVASNVTGIYQKGDKIKLTNSTVKYFYITGVSESGGTTTMTVNGGSSYSLADTSITNNYYSRLDNPMSFPDWFAWTPTYTGITTGNGTNKGWFSVKGKTVFFKTTFTFGSTSSISTTTMTLPITRNTTTVDSSAPIGIMSILEDGPSKLPYFGYILGGGSIRQGNIGSTSDLFVRGQLMQPDKPFVFGTSDKLMTSGNYEMA